jgi:hypothetical protein
MSAGGVTCAARRTRMSVIAMSSEKSSLFIVKTKFVISYIYTILHIEFVNRF